MMKRLYKFPYGAHSILSYGYMSVMLDENGQAQIDESDADEMALVKHFDAEPAPTPVKTKELTPAKEIKSKKDGE